MAELSDLKQFLPSGGSLSAFGSSAINMLVIGFVVLMIIVLLIIFAFIFIRSMKYNKKIIIFEKVGNSWMQTGKDRAMELKYSISGDTVFYLRRRRKYLPRPELQTGRRTYWFAIREDGEWINITLEDIDTAMKEAKAKYLHPEMRYARTALLRNLRDRYEKESWMQKYGAYVGVALNIVMIVVILIFLYLLVDKIQTIGNSLIEAIKSTEPVMEKQQQILAALDNVCATSGIK